jgi:ataxia telangiectasia mutated family protein
MSQRAQSALSVIDEAKQRASTTLKPLADSFDRLTKALIDLAYKPMKDFEEKKRLSSSESFPISKREPLANLTGLQHVPILTLSLPIKPRGDYAKAFVGIEKFKLEFETVGGINAPKKIHCLGTDGKLRPQLLKGLTINHHSTFKEPE